MADDKKEWGFLNVKDWQVKGLRTDPETGKTTTCSINNAECRPMVNAKTGHEFYRVDMPSGAVVDTPEGSVDVSGHSMTVSAKCVHKSKFEGNRGLSFPAGETLAFTRNEKQPDGTYAEVSRVSLTLDEANAAQKAAVKAYVEKHRNAVHTQERPSLSSKRQEATKASEQLAGSHDTPALTRANDAR